jgi:Na+-driven multidrug efflux pump
MIHRRTILITNATVIRLVSMAIFLFIYSIWLDGAAVGGAALVSCMTIEAIYMVIVGHPLLAALEKKKTKPPSYFEIWRFSWPLMITQSSESAVPLVINIFLGHLSNPDLALAGFGVVIGLVRAFLSPLRNLVQTAQTLVHSREDLKAMFQFTSKTVLFFVAVAFVLFSSHLRGIILGNVMGLTPELSMYVTPGIKLTFLVAIFWGYSALLRGILSAMRRTGDIALTAPIRLVMVAMACSVAMFFPNLNGTIVGVLAFSGAYASESIFLLLRLRRNDMAVTNIFNHLHD